MLAGAGFYLIPGTSVVMNVSCVKCDVHEYICLSGGGGGDRYRRRGIPAAVKPEADLRHARYPGQERPQSGQ